MKYIFIVYFFDVVHVTLLYILKEARLHKTGDLENILFLSIYYKQLGMMELISYLEL